MLEGVVRAKQDRLDQAGESFPVLPVLMHGDAAFAGQGVVAETLNLSQLRGYRTGGSVHVVVNNQVGFTTSPTSSRSSFYCTDVGKMIQAPIFHVNGDDPEACARVAKLAFDFRQEFEKDVVIDMVCYRRRGHNEGDDPSMTQPLMYSLIEGKRSVRKIYTESLIGRGDITVEEAEAALKDYQQQLERVFAETGSARGRAADPRPPTLGHRPGAVWSSPPRSATTRPPAADRDRRLASRCSSGSATRTSRRQTFTVHPKLRRCSRSGRRCRARAGSTGATASCSRSARCCSRAPRCASPARTPAAARSCSATPCSPTAQRRGVDPAAVPVEDQARFWVYDSLLSEFAAMGFEYGYSVERPDALVLWEAQFGDFANGAQVVVDEFISSSEQKWGQNSSVTLLLPHGYEGQGPDHSSARIERYLQMCAEDNMTVADAVDARVVLPPAAAAGVRAPAPPAHGVHPEVDAAAEGGHACRRGLHHRRFPPGDRRAAPTPTGPGVDRVLMCTGKVYWDLMAAPGEVRRHPHRDRPRRAAVPAADAWGEAARAVPRRRAGVGAGGAGEPGRVAVRRAQPAEPPSSGPARCGTWPARRRRRRPPGRRRSTRSSSRRWSRRPSPAEPSVTVCAWPVWLGRCRVAG